MAEAPRQEFVFGVARSFSGKEWRLRDGDDRLGLALSQQLGLAEIVGRLLSQRGVDAGGATSYLDPKLSGLLPDPSHLKDMDVAAHRLADAVVAGEGIAVFGDYDVDGATSSALLERYFRAIGVAIQVYIPDRMREGYGPNIAALEKLKAGGAKVVITVDCGTTAYDPLAEAGAIGLDVIVADHHVAEAGLPEAKAGVNPNRLDDDSPHGQLAAVGVTFLLAIALNRQLRERGFFEAGGRTEPDLLGFLDLVALGTVADVVPLTGVNRALVVQGLKILAKRRNPGLVALADGAGIDETPSAYHLGFVLGPRVNAGGRVGEAGLGARLLATEDAGEAREIAARLETCNAERRTIEDGILAAAIASCEEDEGSGAVAFAAGEGWHAGVIGIIASRLKDRYNRPACVVSIGDETCVGSARSIPGFDLGAAVIAARQSGLLINGGGHAMAAGITCAPDKLAEFRAFLEERVARHIASTGFVPSLTVDGVLNAGGATLELIADVQKLGPFGSGNAEPRFAFSGLRVAKSDVVGKDHVRCYLNDAGGARLTAIAFRAADSEMGKALLDRSGVPLNLVGRLRENIWQGRSSVQLLIDDAAHG
ncbi:MAG: single-stranded-DNA-specific exonuclease RecJ [Rhodospirillaceae bacterium]|nr:single-stranded-DNA-specific exonuclease RecJ [Rhodospirillaceae bacterium]